LERSYFVVYLKDKLTVKWPENCTGFGEGSPFFAFGVYRIESLFSITITMKVKTNS